MNQTLERALNAYGGKQRWESAKSIEAEFSTDGLAFFLKQRTPFKRAKITLDVSEPKSQITPIGKAQGFTGVLDGPTVRIQNEDGEVLSERNDARRYFPGARRMLYWDDLDMAYFANYAMWNYLALPALFLRTDIMWTEISDGYVEAVFPKSLPTHCQKQYFKFDVETGLLLQHDYTAEVISRFASAAHVVLDHNESEGITFTSHRRVTPRSWNGSPLGMPTLIEIFIHSLKLKA